MPNTRRTRQGIAFRMDLAGAFLLPAGLNLAMKLHCRSLLRIAALPDSNQTAIPSLQSRYPTACLVSTHRSFQPVAGREGRGDP